MIGPDTRYLRFLNVEYLTSKKACPGEERACRESILTVSSLAWKWHFLHLEFHCLDLVPETYPDGKRLGNVVSCVSRKKQPWWVWNFYVFSFCLRHNLTLECCHEQYGGPKRKQWTGTCPVLRVLTSHSLCLAKGLILQLDFCCVRETKVFIQRNVFMMFIYFLIEFGKF